MTRCQSCLELVGSLEILSNAHRVRAREGTSGKVEAPKAALVHDRIRTAQTVANLPAKVFDAGMARLDDPIFKFRK